MGILKKAGYITIDNVGNIHLTESGRTLSEDIYERHQSIARFFVDALKVDESIAIQDACRIEHVISAESFTQIKKWLQDNEKTTENQQD